MDKYISASDAALQEACRADIRKYVAGLAEKLGRRPRAQVVTYGCQQNEADSQIIAGQLSDFGYEIFMGEKAPFVPEVIIMNTCAVREHAELKALSKAGNLKAKKEQNPYLVTGIGGCMVQQEHRQNDIKNSYPYVDFLFGTNSLPHFPQIFLKAITGGKRVFHVEENDGYLPEGMDVWRESAGKAYVSIMYGCNNFCTYCVVPYVRGRERSREAEKVIAEVKELVKSGCREITLLGQNVNSYGKDLSPSVTFAELCGAICAIEGDFTVRFMTSHPKDVSDELIDCIAENPKMARHIHFPLQAGSDAVLSRMNRRYTFEEYFAKVEKIREKIPDAALSSDIIVGFPGETEEDFEKTLEAIEKVRFDAIFNFIYSKREGTPAASAPDQVPENVKKERLARLIDLQSKIMEDINSGLVGKTVTAFVDGESKKDASMLTLHTESGKLVHAKPKDGVAAGDTVRVKITQARSYRMYGEII